jgi:hypothetical protein
MTTLTHGRQIEVGDDVKRKNVNNKLILTLQLITGCFILMLTACNQQTIVAEIPSPTVIPSTNTPPATATSTASPTTTPIPTATDTPTFTPTPAPVLRQLTTGGCCTQPFFSSDNEHVFFIDKPAPDALTGIYGVSVDNPHEPVLVNEIIGFWNHDQTIVATIEQGDFMRFTRFVDGIAGATNEADNESWLIDTNANWPHFSPDGKQISWNARDETGPYDQRQADVWIAELDGSNPRLVFSTYGGGFISWFPDGKRLLLDGKDRPSDKQRTLFVYDIEAGQRIDLFSENRLREIKLSPGGSWVLFYATFSDDPARSGLWLLSTEGKIQRQLDVSGFGAYRWRDDNRLFYIPMREPGEVSMRLLEVDVTTNEVIPLTDPATVSFSIASGDWDVSPDGQKVVFVNSADFNIWLLDVGK